VNNNSVGWCPLDELVLNKGIGVPTSWFLQILLQIGVCCKLVLTNFL
jgi:hypothetical protein